MQAPVRGHVPTAPDVADDVVDARVRRVTMDGDLEISARVLVRRASRGEQSGDADPRRVDWLLGRHPWLGRDRARDRAARRIEVRVELAAAAAERRGVRARG